MLRLADSKQINRSHFQLTDRVQVEPAASRRKLATKPGPIGKLSFRATDVLKMSFKDKRIFAQLLIDKNRLELQDVIGSGNFGLVYKGTLLDERHSNRKLVAVKTVQGLQCTQEKAQMFIEESARMAGFTNNHILSLIGITVKDERPCIILPYMENGDLHSYIVDTKRKLTVGELIRFGYDVAMGMTYLASKNFIHRDLATRNCMVSSDMTVKVGDFGLSRDLYEGDYYMMKDSSTPLPLRWVAIESILTSKFSIKSDVWSFGVLFWELMTRGLTPYSEIQDNVAVILYMKRGGRLSFPQYVSTDLGNFMQKCWRTDPKERPEFRVIRNFLRDLQTS
ncbi:hypothetical protein LSH36_142g03005 [Paralvinella palmiformis]|uniref:Protein kinase domain-containing protein n=1 Tax=Paralvinella palmiformis TaxID=53620 RepID=A0AAD9N7H5_9ANNE|nr:hypothetical protein LSH36_142g03005 [Paralvinella palmiformis]